MKQLIFIFIASMLFLSCGVKKQITSKEKQKDSVHIEYRERVVFVPDTILVEIPAQDAERTTMDRFSHLENDYAFSDAKINPDGTLTHILKSKPQSKPIPIKKTIEYRDSIIYKDKIVCKNDTITKYVEGKLSFVTRLQIFGFWFLVVFFLILYRKEILKSILSVLFKL